MAATGIRLNREPRLSERRRPLDLNSELTMGRHDGRNCSWVLGLNRAVQGGRKTNIHDLMEQGPTQCVGDLWPPVLEE